MHHSPLGLEMNTYIYTKLITAKTAYYNVQILYQTKQKLSLKLYNLME